jgi:hypothetical protein
MISANILPADFRATRVVPGVEPSQSQCARVTSALIRKLLEHARSSLLLLQTQLIKGTDPGY